MSALIPSSCLGMALSAWEFIIALPDEVHLIWGPSHSFSFVKLLYILSRYLGLVHHSINIVFALKIATFSPTPGVLCLQWLAYKIAVTYLFLNSTNVVLMIRIYAFYRRNWKMGLFLCTLFTGRFTSAVIMAVIYAPMIVFDENCGFYTPKPVIFFFILPEIVSQVLLLGVTFVQQAVFPKNLPNPPPPVVYLLYRDGVLSWAAIFAALVSVLVYSWIGPRKYSDHFVFPVLIWILTTATCRIIINIRHLAEVDGSTEPVQMTSIFETSVERTVPGPSA